MDEWARPSPGEVEVFATGTTTLAAADDETHAFSELLRRGGVTLHEQFEHARDTQARPGHRPGVPTAVSRRQGDPSDIVRPVIVNPETACAAAISGALFADSIPHLSIAPTSDDDDDARYLVWKSTVTHRGRRSVPATLHLRASPSMVVTVLELIPQRSVRWRRHRFVADGVAALDALAERLERLDRRRGQPAVSAAPSEDRPRGRSTDAACSG